MGASSSNHGILVLLILVALSAAWLLGRRSHFKSKDHLPTVIDKEYFVGLNYLLNDEPDDAVDSFIKALAINSTTLETHMALGTLLRRRGKVDKSISVYQDLLARPQLSTDELDKIKIELVRSYVAAGLLDRAERILIELKTASMEIKVAALNQGVVIYQLEKDWSQAVATILDLIKVCPNHERKFYQLQASHFYCELSVKEIEQIHYSHARGFLKKAFQMDKNNVRVSLMLGDVEARLGNYKGAIKALLKVNQQDISFVVETFAPLLKYYQYEGKDKQAEKFVETCLNGVTSSRLLISVGVYIEEKSGKKAAQEFLLKQLRLNPSLSVLSRTIGLVIDESSNPEVLQLCYEVLDAYMHTQAMYQCKSCGFELKKLHWLCPGCATWGNIKPV